MNISETSFITPFLNNQASMGNLMPIFLKKKTQPERSFSPLQNLTAINYEDTTTHLNNRTTQKNAYPVKELEIQANLKNVLSSMNRFVQNKARKEGVLLVGPDNANNYASIQKTLFSKFSSNLDQAFSIIDTFKEQIATFSASDEESATAYIESLQNLLSADTISKNDIVSFLDSVESSIKKGNTTFSNDLSILSEQLIAENPPTQAETITTENGISPISQTQVKTLDVSNAISFLQGNASILGQVKDILNQMLTIVQSTNAESLTSAEQLSLQQDLNQLRIDLSGTLNTVSETLYKTTDTPLIIDGLEVTISGAGVNGAKTSVSNLGLEGTTGMAATNPISLTGTDTVSNLNSAISQISSEETQIDALISQLEGMW